MVLLLILLVVVQPPDDVPHLLHGKVRAARVSEPGEDVERNKVRRMSVRLRTSLSPLPGYLHLTPALSKVVPELSTGSAQRKN